MISSPHNKRVVAAVRLKKRAMRERYRRFLVEGSRGIGEALRSGAVVHEVFAVGSEARLAPAINQAHEAGVPIREVSPEIMGLLTSTVTPQGLVAVADFVDIPMTSIPPEARFVPVLVEVRDPGNAGTILRSADAAGADAVVFTGWSVDVYNPKAVRASAGSLFHVPVAREVEAPSAVGWLRDRGFAVLAADVEGVSSLYETDLSGPTAVLFGNEAYGVPPDIGALADHTVRVPIHRAESLNLAAAATLFFFEAARRRSGSALANVVAGAAHDIRSPIAAIRGFGTTLTRRWERLTDEQKLMMVESILHDAGRLAFIVDQLVDAARMEAGTLHLALTPVDLLEASETLRDDRDRMGLPPVEVSGERAVAMADPDRVRTIIDALVESAGWWGEEGPVRIEVRADPRPMVRVWRAVTALEPGAARSLFEPRTPGSGQGSKVGLFVAKGLARAHGGSLDVSVEDGLAFTLGLAPGGGR